MKVGVLGAGVAGLAAACELADLGHQVTIYERRPWAGGKTYSFRDADSGESVDNGQHVFMGCTTEYIAFLRRLGTLAQARRQRALRVPVFDADGRRSEIASCRLPAPLHLAASLLTFRHLSARDRLGIGRPVLAAMRMEEHERLGFHHQSFADWLRARGQGPAAIRRFWDFLVLPTLNCRCEDASAADALFVLREGFLASWRSSAVGVAGVGLSALHVEPAIRYIEQRGGRIEKRTRIESLGVADGKVHVCADGRALEGNAWVCALPPWEAWEVLSPELRGEPPFTLLPAFEAAPIVNVHLWFERPVVDFTFAAFVGSDLQWVFNRQRLDLAPDSHLQHLVISLSGGANYMDMDKGELANLLVPQLLRAGGRSQQATSPAKVAVIKEPQATFVPAPGLRRPGAETGLADLVLAGAHCNTGWPATMESAVRSGLAAARSLDARRTTLTRADSPAS